MLRARANDDGGFSLVEVIVALVIFGLAAAATTPLLLKALDATQTSKLNTQAKNLLQLRVEAMRNLPFHVARTSGPYIDLLDTYFRDASGAPANRACSTHAYAAGVYTCSLSGSALALPGFTETVAARFVDQNNALVKPSSTYDSQSYTADVPASNTLAVTVTETWTRNGASKSFSASTQISSAATSLSQIVARVRDSAVSIDTAVDDAAVPNTVQFDVGLLNATTGLSTGATANGQVQGALAVLSSGASSSGQATGLVDAPPDQTSFAAVSGSVSTGVPCSGGSVCFGPTAVSGVTGTASNGVPQVGSDTAPLVGALSKSGASGDRGFWVSNVPTGSVQSALVRLGVQTAGSPPASGSPTQLVRSVQQSGNAGYSVPCTGSATAVSNADFATSTGYIASTAGAAHSVTGCATATARRIDILPRAGSSGVGTDGVVQVVLQYAQVSCTASAGAGVATAAFAGTVSFVPYGASSATVISVSSSQATDPLTAALLTKSTSTGGVQLGIAPDGTALWLGDYIRSWSSGTLSRTQGTQNSQADLRAVVISTAATRDADSVNASSINVVAGQLSCLTQDNR